MPHICNKLHFRRCKRIVLWETEFSGEDAAFKRGAFGALDERFPDEHVVFVDGAGGYAFRRIVGERAILFEETFGGGGSHFFFLFVLFRLLRGRDLGKLWVLVGERAGLRAFVEGKVPV
jgi:hypothetical protein